MSLAISEFQIKEILFQAEEYKHRADKYSKNAKEAIEKQELTKAGEFLWGAISSLISAIGVLYGRIPRTHKEIIEFGKKLAIEVKDQNMYSDLNREAQALHANFYHEFLNMETFKQHYIAAIYLIKKLEKILKKETKKIIATLGAKPPRAPLIRC